LGGGRGKKERGLAWAKRGGGKNLVQNAYTSRKRLKDDLLLKKKRGT